MTHRARRRAIIGCALAVCSLLLSGCGPTAAQKSQTISIGWTAWSDAEFVSRLAKRLIEQNTDYSVDLELASIGRQYQGVANGRMDVMMMAWLPDTHARYWRKVEDRVVDLGTLYDGGVLGWAVPAYVPRAQLDSIEDLDKPAVQARLDGRIQGIDPGAGLMQMSAQTLASYHLNNDYTLISGDGASMSEALGAAIKQHRWIVVTGWRPHWMFARYNLRFLKDPKGTLGTSQHIDVLVRQGFATDYPKVAAVLSHMHIPLARLQTALLDAKQHGYQQAIDDFISANHALIQHWFDDHPDAP